MAPRFVNRLPLGKNLSCDQYLTVEIVPMVKPLVQRWMEEVQPDIDRHYRSAGDSLPARQSRSIRADVGWNWHTWVKLGWVQSALNSDVLETPPIGLAKGRCIVIRSTQGEVFPIGMLLYVPRFKCTVKDQVGLRNLIWFFSNAPKEVFLRLLPGMLAPTHIAQSLIDTSLVDAAIECHTDETVLRADRSGGDHLLTFYRTTCNMEQLLKNDSPISSMRRHELDRYFYFSASGSRSFMARFDDLRTVDP